MSPLLRALVLSSVFCTLLSLIAHLASYLDYAFNAAIFMVPLLFVLWPLVVWQWRRVPKRNLVLEVFGTVPTWMKIALVGCVLYPFLNGWLCTSINLGGIPVKLSDGRLVLQKGEQVLKVLTEAEYRHAQAVTARMLTGHLVSFYGMAVIVLRALWIKTSTAMADAKVTGN